MRRRYVSITLCADGESIGAKIQLWCLSLIFHGEKPCVCVCVHTSVNTGTENNPKNGPTPIPSPIWICIIPKTPIRICSLKLCSPDPLPTPYAIFFSSPHAPHHAYINFKIGLSSTAHLHLRIYLGRYFFSFFPPCCCWKAFSGITFFFHWRELFFFINGFLKEKKRESGFTAFLKLWIDVR